MPVQRSWEYIYQKQCTNTTPEHHWIDNDYDTIWAHETYHNNRNSLMLLERNDIKKDTKNVDKCWILQG